MMSKLYKAGIFIFLLIFLKAGADGQTIISPFNGIALPGDSIENDFSFVVAGHLHGSSTNVSGFPASSLLANLDTINNLNATLMISLGDLFLDVDDYFINNYKKSFFEKLNVPLFNAVGNHDLSGDRYEGFFGKTFFSFITNNSLFVFLDTEMNDGSIKGEQMAFFVEAIEKAGANPQIKNIFISSHRPVWAENNSAYKDFFKDNTRTQFGSNNYETDVFPLLVKLISNKPVYWFSGSFGAAPASFFYDKHKTSNITYIITAIRDLKRDAILNVKVNAKGAVSFQPVSLTAQTLNDLESYNTEFWSEHAGQKENKFNYRLLPYLTLKMVSHHYFWIGLALGIVITVTAIVFIRKQKKNPSF